MCLTHLTKPFIIFSGCNGKKVIGKAIGRSSFRITVPQAYDLKLTTTQWGKITGKKQKMGWGRHEEQMAHDSVTSFWALSQNLSCWGATWCPSKELLLYREYINIASTYTHRHCQPVNMPPLPKVVTRHSSLVVELTLKSKDAEGPPSTLPYRSS